MHQCLCEFHTKNYCTNVLRADLGQLNIFWILRGKKGNYKKHLTRQDLQMICPLLRLFKNYKKSNKANQAHLE